MNHLRYFNEGVIGDTIKSIRSKFKHSSKNDRDCLSRTTGIIREIKDILLEISDAGYDVSGPRAISGDLHTGYIWDIYPNQNYSADGPGFKLSEVSEVILRLYDYSSSVGIKMRSRIKHTSIEQNDPDEPEHEVRVWITEKEIPRNLDKYILGIILQFKI